MAKVKYLHGDTTQYGYVFVDGEAVDVTDPKHLTKFAGNAHFEVDFEVDGETDAPLKAEHHGGGRFIITKGETVLAKGLTKTDADAFNSMSYGDKAAYVASLAG